MGYDCGFEAVDFIFLRPKMTGLQSENDLVILPEVIFNLFSVMQKLQAKHLRL